jgi:hypothetical protein
MITDAETKEFDYPAKGKEREVPSQLKMSRMDFPSKGPCDFPQLGCRASEKRPEIEYSHCDAARRNSE